MPKFQPAIAVALFLFPTIASAQALQERNMPLAVAQAIAQASVEACTSKGYNVAAAVVDRAGVLRVLLRADRAGPHTVESARGKAYTSASLRNSTGAVAEAVDKNPAQRNLGQIAGFLLLGGGLPVRVEDEVIGAVGVGGSPSGQLDEECARAGIDKAQPSLR